MLRGVRRAPASRLLKRAYRVRPLRRLCVAAALRLEGGPFYSATLREILSAYHGVQVGAYSYGECLLPGVFPRGVRVGRYVSIAPGVRVFLRNHPTERLSMHPFFYNHRLGLVAEDNIRSGTLEIGHDAWIGMHTIITFRCKRIGIGAVVGAGSIVTRDVPDFAVVAGNPAKLIRHRFDEATCELIRQSRWWEHTVEHCARHLPAMVGPLGNEPIRHPLLAEVAQLSAKEPVVCA